MLKRYFEWIAGEDIGEIASLESIEEIDGETFYNFDNGETCNLRFISKMTQSVADLKGKIVVEITSPSNPWTTETIQPRKYVDESMKGEDIEIPTLHDILRANGSITDITDSDVGKIKLVPPRNQQMIMDLPNPKDYPIRKKPVQKQVEKPIVQKQVEQVTGKTDLVSVEVSQQKQNNDKTEQKQNTYNPVHILVDSCKKKDTTISLDLNIMLPSKYIYNMADSEFENGAEQFIDYVISKIDTKMIINELKLALIEAYQQVYVPDAVITEQ